MYDDTKQYKVNFFFLLSLLLNFCLPDFIAGTRNFTLRAEKNPLSSFLMTEKVHRICFICNFAG